MKAISIKQPYASQIADGSKRCEYRTWRTHYRGTLIVCSSARPATPEARDLDHGVSICRVDIINVREATKKEILALNYTGNRTLYAWKLKNVVNVSNIPVKGKLGIFNLPKSISSKL